MQTVDATAVGDLRRLIPDWERSLRAANKSPKTLKSYKAAAWQLVAFLQAQGMPTEVAKITREHVETFIEGILARSKSSTAANRYRSLNTMFKFLVNEGEIRESPMARMTQPAIGEPSTPILSPDELRALFAACEGKDFVARRDNAIVRLLADTGLRAAEVCGLTVNDIDRDAQVVYVVGKGRRPRAVPYGNKTALAIDRYVRSRDAHRLHAEPWLWLGLRSKLSDVGLRYIIDRRSKQAGLRGVHPHTLRHCFAHEWLADGGTEGDLMALAGWRSRAMLDRYGRSAAAERARDAYRRRGGLGDRL